MKLSSKQLALLAFMESRPPYPTVPGPNVICWNLIPEGIYFTFRTETALLKWLYNLEDRGFLKFEREHFMRITLLGIEAVKRKGEV